MISPTNSHSSYYFFERKWGFVLDKAIHLLKQIFCARVLSFLRFLIFSKLFLYVWKTRKPSCLKHTSSMNIYAHCKNPNNIQNYTGKKLIPLFTFPPHPQLPPTHSPLKWQAWWEFSLQPLWTFQTLFS